MEETLSPFEKSDFAKVINIVFGLHPVDFDNAERKHPDSEIGCVNLGRLGTVPTVTPENTFEGYVRNNLERIGTKLNVLSTHLIELETQITELRTRCDMHFKRIHLKF